MSIKTLFFVFLFMNVISGQLKGIIIIIIIIIVIIIIITHYNHQLLNLTSETVTNVCGINRKT